MTAVTNDSSYWRAFEENELTHSVAHYLMAIDQLRKEFGYARVTDVAGKLNISRGAASLALSQLKERKLVMEDPNRFLLLTNEGEILAHTVEHNFALLTRFFEEVLGVDGEIARADACKMEHLISPESSHALTRFLQVLIADPKRVEKINKEIRNTTCTKEATEALCDLCKPIGECLMPADLMDKAQS
jgi:DtxR family Mn-dependent transcriptional regulator